MCRDPQFIMDDLNFRGRVLLAHRIAEYSMGSALGLTSVSKYALFVTYFPFIIQNGYFVIFYGQYARHVFHKGYYDAVYGKPTY